MNKQEALIYWVNQSERDIQTATDLYATKHYDWCLFIWHLAIEKILKALIIKKDKPLLYIHDLGRLAQTAGLTLTSDFKKQLNEITNYNMEARYDSIKSAFYKKATKQYATEWVKICQTIYNNIKTEL